jgi:nitrogen regulatory protein PII
MKLVTCITRTVKLKEIIDALTSAGIVGMTVTDVHGYGKQGGQLHHFRGSAYEVRLLPKVRIDLALRRPTASARASRARKCCSRRARR